MKKISKIDKKSSKAITLIALIITIIILLILAGITIGTFMGENGLIERSKNARRKTSESQDKENLILESYEDVADSVINGTELPRPIIKSWASNANTDFHISSIRSTITEIEFVNLLNLGEIVAPAEINNTSSWDVSQEGDGSVIAWLDGTKLYIGGINGVKANENAAYMFYKFENVTKIKFSNNFNTSSVTTMRQMFDGAKKLTTIDFGNFNTSNVTTMYGMFSTCYSIVNLDLSSFDTRNVTTMASMFIFCRELKNLNVTSFNTSSLISMNAMFDGCRKLEVLDLSSFDTSHVTNTQSMFDSWDEGLSPNWGEMLIKTIYVSDLWNMSNVTSSSYMFQSCCHLEGGNGTKSSAPYRRIWRISR